MSNPPKPVTSLSPQKRKLLSLLLKDEQVNIAPRQVIPRRSDASPPPLSFAQEQLWFLEQLLPGNVYYNVPIVIRLSGQLNVSALALSLHELVRRHEILRTTFVVMEDRPAQVIAANLILSLPMIDLQEMPELERGLAVERLAAQEAEKPFDLKQSPLLRATLLRPGKREHVLLLTIHHIVCDGWSLDVCHQELGILYAAFSSGKPSPLPELPLQYADFAVWQRQQWQAGALEEQLAYWRQQLAGAPSMLPLPVDHPHPAMLTFQGAIESFTLPRPLFTALQKLSQQEGVTLYMTLLAACKTMLYRYTGQEDIVVGSPIAGRNRSETQELIGLFINMLALRTNLSGNPTFRELLARVREVLLAAYAHQDLPFAKLVETLQPEHSMSYMPLFQVLFTFQNTASKFSTSADLDIDFKESNTRRAQFDLSMDFTQTPEGLRASLKYSTHLFKATTMRRMLGHLQVLLEGIVANADQRLCELPLLTEFERRQLLADWNATQQEYPNELCLHQLFEAQVEHTPEAVAVIFGDEHLTYGELNRRANQLAHYLQASGVGPEVLVGICMERSLEMVVGILGILKAGGTYVPLDPAYPPARLLLMLADTQATILLTQQWLLERLPACKTKILCLDSISAETREGVGPGGPGGEASLAGFGVSPNAPIPQKVLGLCIREALTQQKEENPISEVKAENLAYVIYTAGSTGQPKGTMNTHQGICNRLLWGQARYQLTATDCLMLEASFSFDASVWELFWPLLAGAKVVLVQPGEQRDSAYLVQLIIAQKVSVAHFIPSMLKVLLEEPELEKCTSLKHVFCGGDVLSVELQEQYFARLKAALHNQYGPTEAAVNATYWDCHQGGDCLTVPIGRPITNVQIYLLDTHLHPVPIGAPGELCIGGVGLGRGYFNRPELTAEKFMAHPFSTEPGARLYKTGDLARYRPDGSIEFIGRIDHQVKIRGFRIELGEVAATLSQQPDVQETVVVAQQDVAGEKRLLAYVVPAQQDNVPTIEHLRAFLEQRLPDYMIPSAFVLLHALPLSPNGKLDRRALPMPDTSRSELQAPFVAPGTPIEELVAGIWRDVLAVAQVGRHDNFFALGGHSLLATRLISRLRSALQVELPLRSLFESPTVAALSQRVQACLADAQGQLVPTIIPTVREGELPLSFAQQRLWFLDQLQPNTSFYNIPVALHLHGPLHKAALQESLREIVRRHEALRTTFVTVNGHPQQVITSTVNIPLSVVDLRNMTASERQAIARRLSEEEAQRAFDLAHGPLIRTMLLQLEQQEHVLLVVLHHIVSDGWSMQVFMRELTVQYAAYAAGKSVSLPQLAVQYADFALWQRQWLQGKRLESELSYWQQQLMGLPVLELPTDRPRAAVVGSRGAQQTLSLSKQLTAKLKALSQQQGVTLFMTLLAAFQILLSRYSGQQDIVVGSPIANRTSAQVEGLIGFFVNTLVLRTDLSGNPTFRELVSRVREMALGAYTHQHLPFEKLVEVLQPQRSLSHSPLFQVMFVLQDAPIATPVLSDLTVHIEEVSTQTAKFDLTLFMWQQADRLMGNFEYNADLFDAATISRLQGHLLTLLEGIVAHPQQPLSQLPLLTEAERELLLVTWNDTRATYLKDACLHHLFEAQVEQTPEAVALILQQEQLTYWQLNRRANQLAHYLQTLGVGPEVRVGICMERSPQLVIGILAILKAGGAYVPLDPAYPRERLSFMLADAQVAVLLTRQELLAQFPAHHTRTVCLDACTQTLSQQNEENPVSEVKAENLAYVIYTSGSTGQPRGVMNTHQAVCNCLLCKQATHPLASTDRLLLEASFSFDASVWELFWPLLAAAQVILVEPGGQRDPALLVHLMATQQITIAHFVPSMLKLILQEPHLEECSSLERIFCGGEVLSKDVLEQCSARLTASVYNQYGPTEAAIHTTYWDCRAGSGRVTVPIGRPIANVQIYLLDTHLQPVPVGIAGELHIAGTALARGYINRAELTAERFIPHPFSAEPGARLYKTGDLARYLPDGSVEFVGRLDQQVKVRGFRIELAEIETVLKQAPLVQETAVIVREDRTGEQCLVAYVVPVCQDHAPTIEHLRAFLQQRLPAYMIPSLFVLLQALPLSPNGKLDRQALPAPDGTRPELQEALVAPRDLLELQLMQIWEDILDIHPVGVTDNFFDLGGHSLLAVRLMARIEKQFARDLPLAILFQHTGATIEALASILRQQPASTSPTPLVEIQPLGAKRPLFLVHPAGGTVFCYVDLARSLGLDQPLYGLQAPGISGEGEQDTQIEQLASCYIEAVRAFQPQGPYLLGGWSLGGVIAFEMAQQLRRQGHEVALLALLDSRAPISPYDGTDEDDVVLLVEFVMDLGGLFTRDLPLLYDDLRQLGPDEQLYSVLEQAKLANVIPPDAGFLHIRRLFHLFKANVRAARRYVPQPYPNRVTLLRANERLVEVHQDATGGWSELAIGGVELQMIPGNHYSILRKPHIQVLAQRLKTYLDQTQGTCERLIAKELHYDA